MPQETVSAHGCLRRLGLSASRIHRPSAGDRTAASAPWRVWALLPVASLVAFAQGTASLTVNNIPLSAARVVAIANPQAGTALTYAVQKLPVSRSSTVMNIALPAGSYRIRVLADTLGKALRATGQTTAAVPVSGSVAAAVSLSSVAASVAPSTPSTTPAGAQVPIAFNISDQGDVLESARADLFTGQAPFNLVTGGTLSASAPVSRVVSGSYTATLTVAAPASAGALYYEFRSAIWTGTDYAVLYSPDPTVAPALPWQMPVVTQSGVSLAVSQVPATAGRLVVIADGPGGPVYFRQSITPGTTSTTVQVGLPAGTYRLRAWAETGGAAILATGQTNATVPAGATVNAAMALAPVSLQPDPSTPASSAAGGPIIIRFNLTDAGSVFESASAYLFTGLGAFAVATGGTVTGVVPFAPAGAYVQGSFPLNLPAQDSYLYYAVRTQAFNGAGYSLLCSPDPALSPNSPWTVHAVAGSGVLLTVLGIPSSAQRLAVIADGAGSGTAFAAQTVTPGTGSASVSVGLPAGTWRLRVLADGSSRNLLATGRTSAVVPAAGMAAASVALGALAASLDSATPAGVSPGAPLTTGFLITDPGDVLETGYAYVYSSAAPFNMVTGGTFGGGAPLTQSAPGRYAVSLPLTAPAAPGALFFQLRAQVSLGILGYTVLYSPDSGAGQTLPWRAVVSSSCASPLSPLCVPAAVFRDPAGAVRLTSYGSGTLQNGGTPVAGNPVTAATPAGDLVTVVRGVNNSLQVGYFRAATTVWSWNSPGGQLQGNAAVAVTPAGAAYIVVRDTMNSYWLVSYAPGGACGPWLALGGTFSNDPTAAASADGSVYIIGKDRSNSLWTGQFLPGPGFQGWRQAGGNINGQPAITAGTDAIAYIAVRDNYSSLWMGRLLGSTWLGWSAGGGTMSADPLIAAGGTGTIYAIVQDVYKAAWYRGFTEGTASGWLPWVQTSGTLQDAAAAGLGGDLYIAGRDASNALWWYCSAGSRWTFSGNPSVAAGPLSAAPR